MKHVLLAAFFALAFHATAQEPKSIDPAQVRATIRKSADWQLANPNGTNLRDWMIAPLYDGLIDTSEAIGDPKYLAAVIRMGIQAGWLPGERLYFADRHAVGHAWLDIYLMDPSKTERLKPFQRQFDAILAKPLTEKLAVGRRPKTPGVSTDERWSWCDALYMGPPTWARVAKAAGDARYLDFLDAEYKVAYGDLFDPEENLFYRDARFIGKKSPNGQKVFWSRGNGWVFAGLPMLLEVYPEDRPARKFYVELFQKMARAVVKAQQPDGLWRPSLFDPKDVPIGETSGSAFFVYGLAWGVHHGLLDKEEYWPAVERGWNGLLGCIRPDGLVGYVQRIGDAPDHLTPESTQLYGTGAVLMAGSEILRALGAAADVKSSELLAQAEKIVSNDATPRAIAMLMPQRKDDLAWENDKTAYRIYGPALRNGLEASGIDAWAKSVSRPVVEKWVADDIAGVRSYHENHGEGYDGYKVGDSLGCGGTGIWVGGRLVSADVYDSADVYFTKPDVAEFRARYTFPGIDGAVYHMTRTVRLRMGGHLNEITARFTLDPEGRKPASGLEVAVGLMAQTPKAEFILNEKDGVMAVWDVTQPGNDPMGIGALVPAGSKMLRQPHRETEPKADQAIALLRTDKNGEVRYRAGFGWPKDGEITSLDAWLGYLARQRGEAPPAR